MRPDFDPVIHGIAGLGRPPGLRVFHHAVCLRCAGMVCGVCLWTIHHPSTPGTPREVTTLCSEAVQCKCQQ